LAVSVSRREVKAIEVRMDELSDLVPTLREAGGYADVFVSDAGGIQIEPRDEQGTCPFLFRRQGRSLCSIHHVALKGGRAVAALKPRACRHWPLTVDEHGECLWITVHPSATEIGCVAPLADLPGQPSLRDAFADEIGELYRLIGG